MEESKKLPEFSSLDELVGFLENNDTGDYLDTMPEVYFDVSRGREARNRKRTINVSDEAKLAFAVFIDATDEGHKGHWLPVDEDIVKEVFARAYAEHTSAQSFFAQLFKSEQERLGIQGFVKEDPRVLNERWAALLKEKRKQPI